MRSTRRETRDSIHRRHVISFLARKGAGETLLHSRPASRITRLGGAFACAAVFALSSAHSADLVDPTRPPMPVHRSGPAQVTEASVRVTAIFTNGERRIAVLDGQVVKAGDRVGDITIHEITADGVRFSRGGRVEFARLPKQDATVRRLAAGSEEGQ